jgi:hypothetical protein
VSLPAGSDKLAFLDGYLFRVIVDILKSEGAEASGLYDFYKARVEQVGTALSHYDRMLFDYVLSRFDRQSRRILHAGSGLGTLASALAMAGYRIAGVEQDEPRLRSAHRVRAALAEAWPAAVDQYDLIGGEFPTIVANTHWMTQETVLVFTNCGATWTEELFTRILKSLPSFGDIILDARLFGDIRESPTERGALLERMESQGLRATLMAETPADAFYYHLTHRRDVP